MTTDSGRPTARPGARERARRAMTAQIAEIATELFVERGYDETTVEDICAAAGIGRTSFFRYFRSKEDVLLYDFEGLDEPILEALQERPAGESPWTALCRAIEPLAARYAGGDARLLQVLRLVIGTPSLGVVHRDKLDKWAVTLRPEMARRLGSPADDPADPAPKAVIAAGLACLDAALEAWVASDGTQDLQKLFDRAARAVG